MALKAGTRLGSYEIVALIGAGGQGEVYRARDTRLDRTVAIKVLPSHLTDRPDLRERLEREARAVSSLNHPHICTLFDIGKHEGADFLVMEYLEGETLAARLSKGPLPLEQALRWAVDVAGALAAAHRAGITHRDLKPGNVMLTKSGPKLLDFGLAKSRPVPSHNSQSEAPTGAALTREGAILGTLPYMSPEQIEGKGADARTDIFALGATLYEMVTARKAFEGNSQGSTLAAILEHEPPSMSTLQPTVPAGLEHLVRRCLAKDPDERWQSATDVVHELRWILETGSRSQPADAATPSRNSWAWIAAALIGWIAAAAVSFVHFREAAPARQVMRYSIPLPKEGQSEGVYFNFHLSPDGRYIAVSAVLEETLGIYVRELDTWEFRPLAGTDNSDFFWSPDSRHIGFFDSKDRKLKKVSVSGGPAEEICEANPTTLYVYDAHGTWSREGVILFSTPSGGPLLRVPAAGGEPSPATMAEGGVSHTYPVFLPDGRHFLYTSGGPSPGIYLASLDNPAGRRLLADGSSVEFAPAASGRGYSHLIFIREGNLMAQRFDANALELQGDVFLVAERALLDDSGGAAVSVSGNGILAYLSGRSREFDSRLAWFNRSGEVVAYEGALGPPAPFALSPDEESVAVLRRQAGPRIGDLWMRELSRGLEIRLTHDNAVSGMANIVWSPGSGHIAFSRVAPGTVDLYRRDVRASGADEPILRNANRKILTDWSRSGFLVYTEIAPRTGSDLWYVPPSGGAEGNAKPVPFLQTEFGESFGQVSPDSRWLAYISNESGDYEVYVRPFPSGAGKWRISKSAGKHVGSTTTQPRWSRDGKELFYLTGPVGRFTLMVVPLKLAPRPGAGFDFDPPRPLFQVRANTYDPESSTFFYSVSSDGQRFLFNHVDSASEPVLNVIVNWEHAAQGSR